MVKSLLTNTIDVVATGANVTQYWLLGTGSIFPVNASSEATVAVPYPAGTFSKLYVRVVANTTTGDATVTVRKNSTDTALTLTIPAGQTGPFEDSTHSFTTTSGDLIDYKTVTTGTGTVSFTIMSVIFDATTNCVSKLLVDGYNTAVTSATRFQAVSGAATSSTATATVADNTIRKVATIKNFSTYVSVNARTTNTSIFLRKNTTDTTITLVYGNVETGLKQDTTHTTTTAVDDTIVYRMATLVGAETITTIYHGIEVEHATHGLVSGSSMGTSVDTTPDFGTTSYIALGGTTQVQSTETFSKQKPRAGFIISELTLRANANTLNGTCIVTLRKNGVDTALTVTMAAGSTTPVTDSTHSVAVGSNDEINFSVVCAGSSGEITIRQLAVWLKPVPEKSLSESITVSEPSMIRRTARLRSSAAETVNISETRNRVNGAVRPMAAQTVIIAGTVNRVVVRGLTAIHKTITDTAITISSTITRLKRVWRLQPP
jgi:hypothetical protein